MNTPSTEQQYIIDNIIKGYNICCCAVAGSGERLDWFFTMGR